MAPHFTTASRRQQSEATEAHLRQVTARLERTEHRLLRLENTLRGVARETHGLAIGGPCTRCDRSHLLVTRQTVYCPQCGYRRSL